MLKQAILQPVEFERIASKPKVGLEMKVGQYRNGPAVIRDFKHRGAWQLRLLDDLRASSESAGAVMSDGSVKRLIHTELL
ncbi:hypothetical protein BFP70_19520 [Thioclava sp. SK-1]|nr:hypothetical protein BFP70_19520 [Thioclava sp. SK-1]